MAPRRKNVRQRESMKTLLLGQGVEVEDVFRIMSAGDAGEDGDLAICMATGGALIECVVKDGKVTEILTGWQG